MCDVSPSLLSARLDIFPVSFPSSLSFIIWFSKNGLMAWHTYMNILAEHYSIKQPKMFFFSVQSALTMSALTTVMIKIWEKISSVCLGTWDLRICSHSAPEAMTTWCVLDSQCGCLLPSLTFLSWDLLYIYLFYKMSMSTKKFSERFKKYRQYGWRIRSVLLLVFTVCGFDDWQCLQW